MRTDIYFTQRYEKLRTFDERVNQWSHVLLKNYYFFQEFLRALDQKLFCPSFNSKFKTKIPAKING